VKSVLYNFNCGGQRSKIVKRERIWK